LCEKCLLVRFKFRCNILISGKIIKEMPGSVTKWDTLYKTFDYVDVVLWLLLVLPVHILDT